MRPGSSGCRGALTFGVPGRRGYASLVRRFLTPLWLVKHAVVIILVTTFLLLGWWQVSRALEGNKLSVGYAAEWPLFAVFVVAMWVREVRTELHPPSPEPIPTETAAAPEAVPAPGMPIAVPIAVSTGAAGNDPGGAVDDDPADDPALAAYNEYLAWLAADPSRRPSDYRPTTTGRD